jgi:hypothetical protein
MPPERIRIGPLSRYVLERAEWLGEDDFPASQEWADELERLLCHLQVQGRLDLLLPRLTAMDGKHRDSALAEARVSFLFKRIGFRILGYDPPGADGYEGDLLMQWPGTEPIFVEVKAPSWRGEITPEKREDRKRLTTTQKQEIKTRHQEPKYKDLEFMWIDPAGQVLDVVGRNALKKLQDDQPNLVVVADDLFVSAVHLPTLAAKAKQCMSDPRWNRLGGLLLVKAVVPAASEWSILPQVEYGIHFIENLAALKSCALPANVSNGLKLSSENYIQTVRKRRERLSVG